MKISKILRKAAWYHLNTDKCEYGLRSKLPSYCCMAINRVNAPIKDLNKARNYFAKWILEDWCTFYTYSVEISFPIKHGSVNEYYRDYPKEIQAWRATALFLVADIAETEGK